MSETTTPATTEATPVTKTETTNNLVIDQYGHEIVRFITPVLAGWLITAGAKAGFHMTTAEAYSKIFPFVTSGYYVIVRWLETKVPEFGRLLGVKSTRPSVAAIVVPAPATSQPTK
jgi:hypothetical protein